MTRKILFSIIITIATLICLEIGFRQLVQPSVKSYGTLFNKELPPLNLIPTDIISDWESGKDHKNELIDSIVVDGKKLTSSDLYGVFREDGTLGFTVKENSSSTNGWRQYNNFGARSSEPLSSKRQPNRMRVLFFGDSYTSGSRVPGDQTFPFYLSRRKRDIEFVNFGVDGYSTGQAFLRFETLKDKLDFDRVFLVFVPSADLWRDINVNRYISYAWAGYYCYNLPILVMEEGKLKLIPAPYDSLDEFFTDNRDHVTPRYKDHLRKHDYYYNSLFDSDFLLDNFIIFKLFKKFIYRLKYLYKDKFEASNNILMDTHFKAMIVTKGIIEEMAKEVQAKGAEFSLIILPTKDDISQYQISDSYKKTWDEMASFICSGEIVCYDLMEDFSVLNIEKLDTGYDGSHNGPQTNALIADFILNKAF